MGKAPPTASFQRENNYMGCLSRVALTYAGKKSKKEGCSLSGFETIGELALSKTGWLAMAARRSGEEKANF